MRMRSSSRIPPGLQQVFVESQGGVDISKIHAPTDGIATKVFGTEKKHQFPKAPGLSALKRHRSRELKGETAADHYRRVNAVKAREYHPDSPQAFLDKELQARGYSTKKYISLEGGYYCRPTPLQKASYGSKINEAVVKSNPSLLRRMMDNGLSPNPCNDFGESLVHRISRRGDAKLLGILMSAGCCLQIVDDYGRTPLHDACWKAEPSPEVLSMILKADRHLIRLLDCRSFVPLDYVRKEAWPQLIEYLEANLDEFFPQRTVDEGVERPPPLTIRAPHSTPVPDPRFAVSPEAATLVANGEIEPEEALDWEEDDDDSWDSEYDSDDSYDSDTSSEGDFNEAELAEICMRAGGPLAVARSCFGDKVQITSRSRKSS